jgi:hypothetical protein
MPAKQAVPFALAGLLALFASTAILIQSGADSGGRDAPTAVLNRGSLSSGVVRGRIVDADTGAPVADAQVDYEDMASFGVTGGSPDDWKSGSTTSDAGGSFSIHGLSASHWMIRAKTAERRGGIRDVRLSNLRPVAEVEIRMQLEVVESRSVAGRVVDEAARPVVGARLSERRGSFGRADNHGRPVVVSGADGEFSVSSTGWFDVDHPDFRPEVLELGDGTTAVLRRERRPWRGRAVDEDGAPVARATIVARSVCASDACAPERRETTLLSDSGGAFTWMEAAPGPLEVEITAPGFLRRVHSFATGNVLPGVYDESVKSPPEWTAELRRGCEIRGVVRFNDDDAPVVGAEVAAIDGDYRPHSTAKTDAAGSFTLLAPRCNVLKFKFTGGGVPSIVVDDPLKDGSGIRDLRVGRDPRFSVRVVDAADGSPVAGAWIAPRNRVSMAAGLTSSNGVAQLLLTSDREEVVVKAWGYVTTDASLDRSRRSQPIVVELPRAAPFGGMLVHDEGLVEGRLSVVAERVGPTRERRETLIDATGYFEFNDAAPGRWRLTPVIGASLATTNFGYEVVAGDAVEYEIGPGGAARLRLAARRCGTANISVPSPVGAQSKHAVVVVSRLDGSPIATASPDAPADALRRLMFLHAYDGTAGFTAPAGVYRLVVARDSGAAVTRAVSIAGGSTSEVIVE